MLNKNIKIALVLWLGGVVWLGLTAMNRDYNINKDKQNITEAIDSYKDDAYKGGHGIWNLSRLLVYMESKNINVGTSISRIADSNGNYIKVTVRVTKESAFKFLGYSYEVSKNLPMDKKLVLDTTGMSSDEIVKTSKDGTLIVDGSSTIDIREATLSNNMMAGGGGGGSYIQVNKDMSLKSATPSGFGGTGTMHEMTKEEYERALKNPQGGDIRYMNP